MTRVVCGRAALLAALIVCTARPARAQLDFDSDGVCRPRASSNEAKLLAFYSAPFAFTGLSGLLPTDGDSGMRIWIGGEATVVPTPAASVRTSDRCYGIKKTENTNLAPVLPRPRLLIALPNGFALEASYLPPLTVAGATPNIGSAALSWARAVNGRLGVLLRAHGTFGVLRGPITCSETTIQQVNNTAPCFGTKVSDDEYRPNMLGGEGAVTVAFSDKVHAYGGAGFTRLTSRFNVNFQGTNASDNTQIEISLTRVPFFGGLSWRALPRLELQAQAYSVPEDLTTVRLGAMYRLR
jgi:hypothetical protein